MQPTLCRRRHGFSAKVTRSQWEVSCTSNVSVPCLSTCSSFQPPTAHRLQTALSSVSSLPALASFSKSFSSLPCMCTITLSLLKKDGHKATPKARSLLCPCSGHSPLEMLFLVYRAFLNQQSLTFERLKTPVRVKPTLTHILTALHLMLLLRGEALLRSTHVVPQADRRSIPSHTTLRQTQM